MVCSSMDSIMDPGNGIHTDVLPGLQDGYSLAFSDFLGSDIPCYPSMQSDLHAGIGANDPEVRTGGCLILLCSFFSPTCRQLVKFQEIITVFLA